jgi:hypothetical protein
LKISRLVVLVAAAAVLACAGACGKSSPTEPPPPPGGARNESEPNDFSAQALGTLTTTDFVVTGSISGGGDVDLYSVTAADVFALYASLDWSTASDLELTISDANGVFVRHVDSAGHPEACTTGALPAGTYTVRVGSLTLSGTSYQLALGRR